MLDFKSHIFHQTLYMYISSTQQYILVIYIYIHSGLYVHTVVIVTSRLTCDIYGDIEIAGATTCRGTTGNPSSIVHTGKDRYVQIQPVARSERCQNTVVCLVDPFQAGQHQLREVRVAVESHCLTSNH